MFVGRVIGGLNLQNTLNTLLPLSHLFWHLFFRNLLCLIINKLLIKVDQTVFYCSVEE